MADDRPLELPEEAIGRIDGKLADLESTVLKRITDAVAEARRRPTGTIEPVFRSMPEPGTLFLQGQTVSRTDYAALWAWAQASGAVVTGGYTVGNGSTTFGLPDMRDRVLVGAGGTVALGGTGGAATRTLTAANLPAHKHDVSAATHSPHDHTGGTTNAGLHFGHSDGGTFLAAPGGVAVTGAPNDPQGGHTHGLNIDTASAGSHSVTESTVGSGTAFDNRPPYLGVNVAVWT